MEGESSVRKRVLWAAVVIVLLVCFLCAVLLPRFHGLLAGTGTLSWQTYPSLPPYIDERGFGEGSLVKSPILQMPALTIALTAKQPTPRIMQQLVPSLPPDALFHYNAYHPFLPQISPSAPPHPNPAVVDGRRPPMSEAPIQSTTHEGIASPPAVVSHSNLAPQVAMDQMVPTPPPDVRSERSHLATASPPNKALPPVEDAENGFLFSPPSLSPSIPHARKRVSGKRNHETAPKTHILSPGGAMIERAPPPMVESAPLAAPPKQPLKLSSMQDTAPSISAASPSVGLNIQEPAASPPWVSPPIDWWQHNSHSWPPTAPEQGTPHAHPTFKRTASPPSVTHPQPNAPSKSLITEGSSPVSAPSNLLPSPLPVIAPAPQQVNRSIPSASKHHKETTNHFPSPPSVSPPNERGPSTSPAYSQNPLPPAVSPVWRSHMPRVAPSLHRGLPHSPAKSPLPSIESSGSPSGSSYPSVVSPSPSPSEKPRKPAVPLPARVLPPPPPNQDCEQFECREPYTNSPPGSACGCVLPMQIGLRLSVALYTFFPLVSELALEVANGVQMNASQVRIMGANADSQQQDKTVVLINLVPLTPRFSTNTALSIYEKFWHKQVAINNVSFGDYEVLYIRYPGLPPPPPSAQADIAVNGRPYIPGNGSPILKPIGVDVSKRKKKLGGSLLTIIALSSAIAFVICLGVLWFFVFKHRNRSQRSKPLPPVMISTFRKSSGIGSPLSGSGPSSVSLSFGSSVPTYKGSAKTFSLAEMERATNNFDPARVLGEGGFGRVYSGCLEDGKKVAVKVLKRDDQQGGREFLAEVEMLSRLHHRNLVKLIGICTEEHYRCLVYELVPNGSVESHLHGTSCTVIAHNVNHFYTFCSEILAGLFLNFNHRVTGVDKDIAPLDWGARMKIALGAARGLAYLHEDSSPRVIHRDFKSSNILLEDDFTPKVSDFGLARAAVEEGSEHISTRVMGTFGYVAPEYAMTGHLLVKSDVYSYGVVLLELLTGRKPVDMSQPQGQENLVAWARPLLTSKDGLEIIVDPALSGSYPFDTVAKVAAIASMCVQPEVSHRPFMGEVVQALKLVCSDTDEKNGGSGSCSQEQLSLHDLETKTSSVTSVHLAHTSPIADDCSQNLEAGRALSTSDVLSSSARVSRPTTSYRRHSSSGPLRTSRRQPFWQRLRGLSSGTVSEHGVALRAWPGLYSHSDEL
ncbi:receptor-like serine/threonine-protein kinase ALE2 isoform X3 [Nymphaea colorata]|uniref:receptor-like serine/threonine-protein kinase ALE2 isoform X3 n=1 Tax=Nymphaea colorata TaxID=210225 RepID=UPI00129E687F|nr:receptor-like serine/threonine-protein kinase ALE2 isoform X3 [Nymphaea colorata]